MGLRDSTVLYGLKVGSFRGGYRSEMQARQEILDGYGPLPWDRSDLARWERVVIFLEELAVTQGTFAGSRLKLRDFQLDFIKAVYSENAAGERPVRTAIMSLGRKNGKTALAAGLALCHLTGPEAESRGEVYSCANDRAQAARIFHEMIAMVNAHRYLLARTAAMHFHKQMHDLQNGSTFQALSREAKTKMGLSPSFCIYDEYGQSPDDQLYRAMDSAMGARSAPLMMIISTQAADENAPLSRLIDYGKQVKAGTIKDPSFHLTLYAAGEKDNPWSEKTWRKANPALDDFRSLEDVKRQARQAKRMPAQENSFRNLILNQRVSAHTRFISKSTWDKCKKKPRIPDGVKVYAALDLGSTKDMSALILLHQDIEGYFHVLPFYWLPGSIDARANEDSMPYAAWVKEGFLTPAGDATDPAMIARKIAELNGRYRIQTLAFDRWRIAEIKRELEDIGCRVPLLEHGQGFKDLSPAVDVCERMVDSGRLRHGGHPILAMNVANAVITRDAANNRKLDKSKSTGRIDGLVALCMAFSPAVVKLEKPFDIRSMIA